MLATMLHQWAGRYITTTQQRRYSPHKNARVRAFLSDAVGGFPVLWVVEGLRAMIHLSLFLFFAGLLIFLTNINHSVFRAVVWWMALSTAAYVCITLLPIFRPNSPYYAPLSPTIWFLYAGIPYVAFKVLSMVRPSRRFDKLKTQYYNRLLDGMRKTVEKIALQLSSEIDVRVLGLTLDALEEDDARAEFFAAIPGFFGSKLVNDVREHLPKEFRTKFSRALDGFLDRTFSSKLVSESAQIYQLITCLKATHAAVGQNGISQILADILGERWPDLLQSVDMAHTLRRWSNRDNDETTHYVRRIVTRVVAGARERDDRWIALVNAEFGVPDHILRDNIDHGDSALFSLLIHITRQAFGTGSWTPFILLSLTQFDIHSTLPGLQQEFCALWNEILEEARKDGADSPAVLILKEIRHTFIALHQGTDAAPTAFSAHTYHFDIVLEQPQSYPFCNVSSHHPDHTPQNPITNHLTVPSATGADNPSLPLSTATAQPTSSESLDRARHSTPLEIQRVPTNVVHTATQQAEANVAPRSSSPAYLLLRPSIHILSYRQTSPSPPTFLIQIAPLTTSVTASSVLESVGPITGHENTWDCNTPVPIGVTRLSPESALSAADISAGIMQPDDPTPREHGEHALGTGATPQSLATTSPILLHPDPSPTTNSPSTRPHVPSFSEPDPAHTSPHPPDGFRLTDISDSPSDLDIILTATVSHLLRSNGLPADLKADVAAPSVAASCFSETPSAVQPIPQPISTSGAAPQRNEEITIVPPIVISDSQPSPILPELLALRDDMNPLRLDSCIESTLIQPDHALRPLESISSFPITALPHISLQASSVPGVRRSTSIGTISTPDNSDTRDLCSPIAMESASRFPDTEDHHGIT